ncbi:MAG: hypothetical protein K2Y20_08110 [Sphingomonas sp.]|nr:hypothetical protein [Sphingomonas sp.]
MVVESLVAAAAKAALGAIDPCEVIKSCIAGVLGNRADAGLSNALRLATTLQSSIPENHNVLKAMQSAFVGSIQAMAEACDSVGGTPEDNFSRRALQRFAVGKELEALDLANPNLPIADLDERVRAIYGQQSGAPATASTESVIALVEAGMGIPLSDAHRRVFLEGTAKSGAWATLFELFFATEVKKVKELFAILTFDRLNELVAHADAHEGLLHQIIGKIDHLAQQNAQGQAEIMAALSALNATQRAGTGAPDAALEVLAKAIDDDRLEPEDKARLAQIYGAHLRQTSNIPPMLIDSLVRALSTPDDMRLLGDALKDMGGAERLDLINARVAELELEEQHLASRYRALASFAALESQSRAIELYRRAVDLDPTDVMAWIELGRLRRVFGSLADARACFGAARQRVSNEYFRCVLHNEFGDILCAEGQLREARTEFEAGLEIIDHLARKEPEGWHLQRELSVSFNKLGDVEVASGNLAAARARFEAGLGIRERLAAREPGNAGWQRDLSVSFDRLGDVEVAAGNLAAARARFDAGLCIAERLAAQEPGNAQWQRDLSVSLNKLGNVEVAAGNLAAARARFEAGLGIRERLAAQEPGNAEWQRDVFISNAKLAQLAEATGDRAGAIARFEAAEAIMASLASAKPDHPGFARDLAQVRGDLARLRAEA